MSLVFQKELDAVRNWQGISSSGVVTQIIGLLIESIGPSVRLGEICMIYNKRKEAIPCEVVGFKDNRVLLMSMGEMTHIAPGSEVYPTNQVALVPVSQSMLGRVLDGLGNPIDGK